MASSNFEEDFYGEIKMFVMYTAIQININGELHSVNK